MKRKTIKHNLFKKIVFIPFVVIAMWLLGYFLLIIAYCIPTKAMTPHLKESSRIFKEEGTYPYLSGQVNSRLDNYSDALMILTATHNSSESIWKAAINASRYEIKGKNPAEVLVAIDNGEKEFFDVTYARYWHGYLILLKLLLTFFSYNQIRYLIMCAQLSLFICLIVQLTLKNKKLIIPTFLMWMFMSPLATMNSLQYNSVMIILFICMSLILYFVNRWKTNMYLWGILFLFVGIATSYFDLLTYPLVTLGVPLSLWLAFNPSPYFLKNIKNVMFISGFWLIGYAGMWAGKWILGSIVTGNNIIENAFSAILNRTSSVSTSDQQIISFAKVIKRQLLASQHSIFYIVLLLLICSFIYQIIKKRRYPLSYVLVYLIIGIYPFIWYFVLKNHSYIHFWFTYRELSITIYAITVCALNCIPIQKLDTLNRKR